MRWPERITRAFRHREQVQESDPPATEGPAVLIAPEPDSWMPETREEQERRTAHTKERMIFMRQELGVAGAGDNPTPKQILAEWWSNIDRAMSLAYQIAKDHPHHVMDIVLPLSALLDRIETTDWETRIQYRKVMSFHAKKKPRMPNGQPKLETEFERYVHKIQMFYLLVFAAHPERKADSISMLRSALSSALDHAADTLPSDETFQQFERQFADVSGGT